MRLFVGNIAFRSTEEDLREFFNELKFPPSECKLMTDRDTGESRGFGFVEIPDDQEAAKAIQVANGYEFMGRVLIVNEARPLERRPEREQRGARR